MLTPLLDMFTIILIFLIVSFNAEDYDFKLDDKVKLPESTARSQFKPGINVSIRSDGVTVEQEPILKLTGGRAEEQYYLAGESPEVVTLLTKYFDDLKDADEEDGALTDDSLASQPSATDDVVLTIQADSSLDYETLYLILRSAAKAGFFKYRLAVLRD